MAPRSYETKLFRKPITGLRRRRGRGRGPAGAVPCGTQVAGENAPMAAPSPPSASDRLLVVEDDETIRETVAEALRLEGYAVSACGDGRQALALLEHGEAEGGFDLLVLDLMLPGLGGLELCRRLRQRRHTTPILVVSARDSESDRVLGLEVGADDYLVKPFGMLELVARCRALLRRARSGAAVAPASTATGDAAPAAGGEGPIEHGALRLYPEECRVSRAGLDLRLSPKEYRLLELFMRHPRQVWSRDRLLERVWGLDFMGDSKTVDVHIRWLREKLELDPSNPRHILTVRGFGYRFV